MAAGNSRNASDAAYKTVAELALRDHVGLLKKVRARKCERPGGLLHFVRLMWNYVEPHREFQENWHIEAICEHLEAVTFGQITRLLINVPPGFMKSLLLNVFWPAWEWGPMRMPSMRFIAASYSQDLTVRDNTKFRMIIESDLYKENWGNAFGPGLQYNLEKVSNNKTGWKLATSVGGVGTGERGDRVVIDDPNSVKDVESDVRRDSTNQWFTEVIPSRINDPTLSAILVIQQRTHEEDVSGVILSRGMEYDHLMIPMRYDSTRRYTTSIGWTDPRGLDENGEETDEKDGALAWPHRYTEKVTSREEGIMGPFATAGQFQQSPVPRGGAIFEREWWQTWPISDDRKITFPPFEYVVASVDTAFTEKQENDFCAMTVWGIFRDAGESIMARHIDDPAGMMRIAKEERPKVMLMWAWQKRLHLHGPTDERPLNVSLAEWESPYWVAERRKKWGLVEWVVDTARRFKIHHLLIETQAAGHSLEQELRRLHGQSGEWGVQLIPAKGDKKARAIAVQHIFSNGLVYAPTYTDGRNPTWCEAVVDQFSSFPKTRYKDLVDSGTHALQHLRDTGLLVRKEEHDRSYEEDMKYRRAPAPLYEV